MKIKDHITDSIQNIWANKLRTFLTTLGIFIGIVSVTLMLSLGAVLQKSALAQLGASGNILTISSQKKFDGQKNKPLENQDLKGLKELSSEITMISAYKKDWETVFFGQKEHRSEIIFVDAQYKKITETKMESGRWFSAQELSDGEKVLVLEKKSAKKLFKNESPIGELVQIKNNFFTVIGVTKSKSGLNEDYGIGNFFAPLLVAQKSIYGNNEITAIDVFIADVKKMSELKKNITYHLIKSRSIQKVHSLNFNLRSSDGDIKIIKDISTGIQIFLGVLGVISLVVGGIGVMNIMIVSVTERTKEIGIRKALGAQNKDITIQFLAESICLSLLGAFSGIVASYLLMSLGGFIFKILVPSQAHIEFSLSVNALVISVLSALFVGIFFGIIPARKAAKLKTIDALRYE